MTDDYTTTFEATREPNLENPVLVEGLPGHGLVASIAVDHLTDQLGLEQYGTITSDAFPPVVTFRDGLVRDLVRVYAGSSPDVLTLQSDVALPQRAYSPLADCVLSDLTDRVERAIFLVGAPAESESQLGEVRGVATTPAERDALENAGIEPGAEPGIVGGVTGALFKECHEANVPAVVLIVRAHPYLPDPAAARSVIENALEPLVEFDIDTSELEAQAGEIRRQMEQVAEQYREAVEDRHSEEQASSRMYQ